MKIPFLALILQGIPETLGIVTLSYVIAKIPINWKKMFLIALVIAVTSFIIRLFPITFGVHTVILLGLLFILLIKIGQGNINSSLIASLLSYLTIIITETACLSILMPLFGVTSEVFFSNTTVRILITYPQVFIIFILAFIIYKARNKKMNA